VAEGIDAAGDIVGTTPVGACSGGFLDQGGTAVSVGPCTTSAVDAITAGGSTMLTYNQGNWSLVPTATPDAAGTPLDITPSQSGAVLPGGSEWGAYVQSSRATAPCSNSGYVLLDALAINDNGDIVGLADSTTTGDDVGFLLKSAPRTSATALACTPAGEKALTCTAKVTDTTGDGSVRIPTGIVQLTEAAGSLAAPSCTLSAVSGGAACSDTYTPAPAGTTTGSVQITASYVGDSNFQPSTGSFTLCADGTSLELDSVSTDGPHADGFEIGSQVVLHGCGFHTGMQLIWGAVDQTPEQITGPTSVSADGTTATVTVPWGATTGTVTVTDGGNQATLDGQAVDSWRNTLGLSFRNYGGLTTR
jgi:hypothetical protein